MLLTLTPLLFLSWASFLNDHNVVDSHSVIEKAYRLSKRKGCRAKQYVSSASKTKPNPSDLLVFVSFSIPIVALKKLSHAVAEQGGKLVLRGLVGGSFKKTAKALKALHATVLIDPTLFKKHNIKHVPVFVQGDKKIAGHVSLPYVLSRFQGKKE